MIANHFLVDIFCLWLRDGMLSILRQSDSRVQLWAPEGQPGFHSLRIPAGMHLLRRMIGLRPGTDCQLLINAAQVKFDSSIGDAQGVGDLLVCLAFQQLRK